MLFRDQINHYFAGCLLNIDQFFLYPKKQKIISQNYANHKRFHPLFHFVFVPITLAGLVVAAKSFFSSPNSASGLLALSFLLILLAGLFARMFALKAQDRAARAEEKLRYFILSGKVLPYELTLSQILAIRFAGDEEFLSLVDRAIREKLSSDEIKKAVKNWRGDYHRI